MGKRIRIYNTRIRRLRRVSTIGDLQRMELTRSNDSRYADLALVTDGSEVESILDSLGYHPRTAIDGLFVGVDRGDYCAVWGFVGCVPYLDKPVYRIL